jgi:lipopolysaccharide transport system permease protein
MITGVWRFRGFVWSSVKQEFLARYRGSILGSIWAILNPLALIIVYTVVFSQVMKARLPEIDDPFAYGLYLCAGLLTWGFFAEVLNRSQGMFLERANFLKKTNFPRTTLPVIISGSATLNFLTIFGLFLAFLILTGRFPGPAILAMIPLLVVQQGIAVGLGLILGTVNVFFRDVGQAVGVVLQFWFWLTPIVYPISVLPEEIKDLVLTWNPMAPFVVAYQNIILLGEWPNWIDFLPHLIGAVLVLAAGYFVFIKLSGEMVDEL